MDTSVVEPDPNPDPNLRELKTSGIVHSEDTCYCMLCAQQELYHRIRNGIRNFQ
jgi:hypothetical protein